MDIDDRRQQVALFRYSLIRPLAEPGLSARERGALVRALVSVDHVGPDGRRVEVSAVSVRRWVRAWRTGGFAGLVPAVRAQPRSPSSMAGREAHVLSTTSSRQGPIAQRSSRSTLVWDTFAVGGPAASPVPHRVPSASSAIASPRAGGSSSGCLAGVEQLDSAGQMRRGATVAIRHGRRSQDQRPISW